MPRTKLGTLAITDEPSLMTHRAALPHIPPQAGQTPCRDGARLVEWADSPDVIERIASAKAANPELVAMVRLPLGPECAERALELATAGVDALHLYADWRG